MHHQLQEFSRFFIKRTLRKYYFGQNVMRLLEIPLPSNLILRACYTYILCCPEL